MTLSGVASLLLITFVNRVISTINKYDSLYIVSQNWHIVLRNGVCPSTTVHFQISKRQMHLLSSDKNKRRPSATRLDLLSWKQRKEYMPQFSMFRNPFSHYGFLRTRSSDSMRSSCSSHHQTTNAKGWYTHITVSNFAIQHAHTYIWPSNSLTRPLIYCDGIIHC
jgi:hypothetical protein